jgi:hypothetical protein
MWKIFGVFIGLCALALPATAANNPFFGKHQNQIAFNLGQGFDTGWIVAPPFRPVPYNTIHLQYSQPTTLFSLPARQSVNASMNIGFGKKYHWDWRDFSIPIAFVSEDVALAWGDDWALGAGAGFGFQMQQNDRIGSKLVFQFKIFGRYNISENYGLELFMQHFSNGNTAPENNSYLFWGVGLSYNF